MLPGSRRAGRADLLRYRAAYSGIQYYQPDRIQFAAQRRSNPDLASVGALDLGAHATPGVISIVVQQTLLEGRASH